MNLDTSLDQPAALFRRSQLVSSSLGGGYDTRRSMWSTAYELTLNVLLVTISAVTAARRTDLVSVGIFPVSASPGEAPILSNRSWQASTMDYQTVGQQFTQFYYSVLDGDRSGLASLYRDQSLLTFEGDQFVGVAAISGKYTGLPFTKVQHQVVTCDVQPCLAVQPNGILVFIAGNMLVDDNDNAMKFSQVFHLLPDPSAAGQYWVHNDIFRLNIG